MKKDGITQRAIYLTKDELRYWYKLRVIALERKMSASSIINQLIREYVDVGREIEVDLENEEALHNE